MFINGIRQPDGKLFQGRSLLELVRKVDLYFDDLIEIPTQLRRIEQKLDTLISPRVAKTKLCLAPITATWKQERYVPAGALGGFARIPIRTIAAAKAMSAPEYRVLQAILFCAQGTGLLIAGKIKLGKLVDVPSTHIKVYRESLCNRQILRPTGRLGPYGVKEYELLTHPCFCDVVTASRGGHKTKKGGQNQTPRGTSDVPLKTINKIGNKTINRPQAAETEELVRRLREVCPPEELENNEAGWRKRAREDPRSLRAAIDDLVVRKDNYHLKKVRNLAAYINKQYQFYHTKIKQSDKAIAERRSGKSLSELVRESIAQSETKRDSCARAT